MGEEEQRLKWKDLGILKTPLTFSTERYWQKVTRVNRLSFSLSGSDLKEAFSSWIHSSYQLLTTYQDMEYAGGSCVNICCHY